MRKKSKGRPIADATDGRCDMCARCRCAPSSSRICAEATRSCSARAAGAFSLTIRLLNRLLKPVVNTQSTLRSLLSGGDLRSIGRSNEAAEWVARDPKKAAALVECLWDADPRVRMRAADALEKASLERAKLLQPFKTLLLGLCAEAIQKEVRWHLALTIPRLELSRAECLQMAELLKGYLEDRSSIVKTCAMQGLADLTDQCAELRDGVVEISEA